MPPGLFVFACLFGWFGFPWYYLQEGDEHYREFVSLVCLKHSVWSTDAWKNSLSISTARLPSYVNLFSQGGKCVS